MKRQVKNSAKTIRFTRWSRKGYAIFLSLSRVVTIGFVSKNIADKSCTKSLKTNISIESVSSDREHQDEEERENAINGVLQQNEIIILNQIQDVAAAASGQFIYLTR